MPRAKSKCPCGCGQSPAERTRQRKALCHCGEIAYQSRTAFSRGLLSCHCGGTLEPVCLYDACAAPGELGAAAYSELCARDDEFARRSENHAKRGLGQMRCPDCKSYRPFGSCADPTHLEPCKSCGSVQPAIFLPRVPKLPALQPTMPF
jgi:hypothetical protein